ncbi:ribonuclease domain-containing protein [Deinococcus saxicola]|uniref:ribonuclease domain-containing protein n=1 Tax=Deinococcus saxicola TaxID=249406 RepID=UPI0039EEC647
MFLAACDLPAGGQDPAQSQFPAQTQQTRPPAQQTTPASSRDPQSGLRWVNTSELPREGEQLLRTIAGGGKFRYSKDGVTFGNRERILPRQNGGYYREYTVPTPGEGDRGARRIVCGGQPVTSTAECYYSADHYASFRRIRP